MTHEEWTPTSVGAARGMCPAGPARPINYRMCIDAISSVYRDSVSVRSSERGNLGALASFAVSVIEVGCQ